MEGRDQLDEDVHDGVLDLTCPGEEWRVEISLMRMFMMVAEIKIIRSRRWRGEGGGGVDIFI